jgi:hypothetical protein
MILRELYVWTILPEKQTILPGRCENEMFFEVSQKYDDSYRDF